MYCTQKQKQGSFGRRLLDTDPTRRGPIIPNSGRQLAGTTLLIMPVSHVDCLTYLIYWHIRSVPLHCVGRM